MQLGRQRKNLVSLTIINIIYLLSTYLVLPTIFHIVHDQDFAGIFSVGKNISRSMLYILLVSLFPLGKLVATFWLCYWSDSLKRKPTLLICLLIAILGYASLLIGFYTQSLMALIIGAFVVGMSQTLVHVSRAGISDFVTGLQRLRYYGIFLASYAIAAGIGPQLGSLISNHTFMQWLDHSTPLWLALALTLFNFMLMLEFYRDPEIDIVKNIKLSLGSLLQQLLISTPLCRLLGLTFLLNLTVGLFYFNNFFLLHHIYGISSTTLGVFTLVSGLCVFIGAVVLLPLLTLRYTEVTILKVGAAFFIPFCVLILIPSVYTLFIGSYLLAIVFGIVGPVLTSILVNAYNDEHAGFIIGIQGSLATLAWLISLLLPAQFSFMTANTKLYVFAVFSIIICLTTFKAIDFSRLKPN